MLRVELGRIVGTRQYRQEGRGELRHYRHIRSILIRSTSSRIGGIRSRIQGQAVAGTRRRDKEQERGQEREPDQHQGKRDMAVT